MHGSKRIGIGIETGVETVVKNNGDWIIKELRYRGGDRCLVYIGLSKHTKEEENL